MGDVNSITIPPTPPTAPTPPTNPNLILGKFKSQEEFVNAYKELEQKFHSKEQPQTPTPETPAAPATPPQTAAKIDLGKLNSEFAKDGKLSDASYTELANQGFNRQAVDAYIVGVQAQASAIKNEVGGEDGYEAMTQWASANLTDAEKEAYNSAVNSENIEAAKLAVRGLHAKFTSKFGNQPNLVGGRHGSSGPNPYSSMAEMVTAMQDRRYYTDPTYQKQVEARVAASEFAK